MVGSLQGEFLIVYGRLRPISGERHIPRKLFGLFIYSPGGQESTYQESCCGLVVNRLWHGAAGILCCGVCLWIVYHSGEKVSGGVFQKTAGICIPHLLAASCCYRLGVLPVYQSGDSLPVPGDYVWVWRKWLFQCGRRYLALRKPAVPGHCGYIMHPGGNQPLAETAGSDWQLEAQRVGTCHRASCNQPSANPFVYRLSCGKIL